ncbi:hypothetical protein THICB3600109 [Thiomonas sp. CB3]|nr:hypothetical protein THICB3600109 [Thiomonas sp. CB3]
MSIHAGRRGFAGATIYIGRRFKNDTERLEKLFDLYTKMTAAAAPAKGSKRKADAKPTESTLGL